jgi:hypothetical protein
MATPIPFPDCLRNVYEQLFPALDFDRIHFFLGNPPLPVDPGAGYTEAVGGSEYNIYITNNGVFQPCSLDTFTLMAHELVHCTQYETVGQTTFEMNYLGCVAAGSGTERANPVEGVAYDYQDRLENCISDVWPTMRPCDCPLSGTPTPAHGTSLFDHINANCPELILRAAPVPSCDLWDHEPDFPVSISEEPRIEPFREWVVKKMVQLAVWLFKKLGGYWLVKKTVQSLWKLGVAVKELIFGKGPRPVHIMLSFDEGQSFDESTNVTLGVSGEPPAPLFTLPGSADQFLYVGWVTRKNRVRIVRLPDGIVAKPDAYSSDDSGPSLAFGRTTAFAHDRPFLVWQHRKNRLKLRRLFMTASPDDGFDPVSIQAKVPDDVTAGLAYGNGQLFVAWARKKRQNKIAVKSTPDGGGTWQNEITLSHRARNEGTAALAFGTNRLYLAWASKKKQRLNILTFDVGTNGVLNTSARDHQTLSIRCAKKSGPAIAFGNNRLFLAFTGRKKGNLHVMTFGLDGNGVPHQQNLLRLSPRSRKNAGPGLAFADFGAGGRVLCLAWVQQK